ncbi:ABC transporter substrate-binding protein, partial [Klebsiella pneumoniae]|nr:ABC transporter substrate-binding protein [Klebsiella pneumoniae]
MSAHAALDLRANEQPLPVTRDPQAIAKIPPGYRFVEPGTLTVAISALNSPPLAPLASAHPTRSGCDPAIAPQQAG